MADLLARLERAIEQLFEGLFSFHFRGRVQPLEIARRLTRALEDHKMVGISQVFAPNEFIVGLHPEDFKTIGPFKEAVIPELVTHVEESAAEANYHLVGKPLIIIEENAGIERGDIHVDVRFVRQEEQPLPPPAPTTDLSPSALPAMKGRGQEALLHVLEGPDKDAEYPLRRVTTTIGRGDTNDVALTDNSVSRAHAQIELRPDGFHLKDLGSKNGSFVNGVPSVDTLLKDGDTIAIGATLFHFKAIRIL